MSTILKALKKLEEEKRAAAPETLLGQILVDRGARRRPARSVLLVSAGVAGGLLLALLAGSGIFWLKSPSPVASVAAPAQPLPAEPTVVAAAEPGAAASSPAAPGAKVLSEITTAVDRPVPAAPVLPQAVTVPLGTGEQVPAGLAPAGRDMSPQQVRVDGPQLPPAGQPRAALNLEISEIFPASDAGGAMALVNGLPVMEGTWVDDALVKEIRRGEVLFEIAGRTVVVPLRTAD